MSLSWRTVNFWPRFLVSLACAPLRLECTWRVANSKIGDIDSSFNPNAHLHKNNKLQAVIDGTRRLLTQECPDMETLVESPAFKALAGDRKATDIFEVTLIFGSGWRAMTDLCAQLLTFVLIAAVTGEKRAEYVGTMMGMEAGVQTELRDIIQAVSRIF